MKHLRRIQEMQKKAENTGNYHKFEKAENADTTCIEEHLDGAKDEIRKMQHQGLQGDTVFFFLQRFNFKFLGA